MKTRSSMEPLMADQVDIQIAVLEPAVSADGSRIDYRLTGTDKAGPFDQRRKFNEFWVTRETMVRNWVGLYIPPLPGKKLVGNKDAKFLEVRRRGLQVFCEKVAAQKYLYYSDEFQILLRRPDPEKALLTVPKPTIIPMRERYDQLFGVLLKDKKGSEVNVWAQSCQRNLENTQKSMSLVVDRVGELADARSESISLFGMFASKLMPEYEGKILKEYYGEEPPKMIFED